MMHNPSRLRPNPLVIAGRTEGPSWPSSSVLAAGLLLLCPVADILTGLNFLMSGEDQVISASRVWKSLLLTVALVFAFKAGRNITQYVGLFAWAAGLGLLALVNGLIYGGTVVNMLAFGQLQLFFCGVLILLASVPTHRMDAIVGMYMWTTWCCVAFTVFLGGHTTFGIEIYQGHGTSGLFRAANDASYQFVCASCYLLCHKPRRLSTFFLLLAGSATAIWMLGTKAGLLGLPLCIGWYATEQLSGNKTFTFVMFTFVAGLTVLFCAPVFLLLLDYLPGAERYHYFLRDRDVVNVILSGRSRLAEGALEVVGGYNVWQWFTGTGVDNFRRQVADVLYLERAGRLVEMDWADLIGSMGILGLCWFYGVLTVILRASLAQRSRNTVVISACMVFTVLFSLSAGHVATSASSLTVVAVLCAWTFHRRIGEESRAQPMPASALRNPTATVLSSSAPAFSGMVRRRR